MKEKVLHVVSSIHPGGGPFGYVYNLRAACRKHLIPDIEFYAFAESDIRGGSKKGCEKQNSIRKRLKYNSFLLAIEYFNSSKLLSFFVDSFFESISYYSDKQIDLISEYEVVVFHQVNLLSSWLNNHRVFGQKCYVFPHSPVEISKEYVLNPTFHREVNRVSKGMLLPLMQEKECESYEKSCGIITPSENALNAYFSDNTQLANRFQKIKKHCIFSGLEVAYAEDKIGGDFSSRPSIAFIGRYHADKGFDIFLDAAKQSDDSVVWFCAGSGELETLMHDKVMNIGWQKDIFKIMRSATVLVVPNRVALFDLVILEALALGKPLVLTHVGGSKDFPRSSGIFLCEPNSQSLLKAVSYAVAKFPCGFCEENQKIYKEVFAEKPFAERHLALAKELLADTI